MVNQSQIGFINWEVTGEVPLELSYILRQDQNILSSGFLPQNTFHSGTLPVPPYSYLSFEYERFVEISGNKIVYASDTENILTLPEWTWTQSFYPKSSGVDVIIESPVESEVKIFAPLQIYNGINTKHSVFIESDSDQVYQINYTISISGQELNRNFEVYSLPINSFKPELYHQLFIDAASLNINGQKGIETIVLGALNLVSNPAMVQQFCPTCEGFTLEQLQSLQILALKFLTRYPTPEEFVKRFALWAKYQNLDFEASNPILTTNQKLAFLLMAMHICYTLLNIKYKNILRQNLDQMNSYRMFQWYETVEPGFTSFISPFYQKVADKELTLESMWNYQDAVTF